MADNNNLDIFYSDDNEKYQNIAGCLGTRFSSFKVKRQPKEQVWIRNQMQYDGVYEPEILKKIKHGKSSIYNRVTTAKIDQFKARSTELVLPTGDKNFALYPTPNPNLPLNVLTDTLNQLKAQALQSAQQNPNPDGSMPQITIAQQDVESAIMGVARTRAQKMEDTCFDQLLDTDYSEFISKVLYSGAIFGTGLVKGPFNIQQKATTYSQDQYGNWSPKSQILYKPYYEFVKVWDFFPDLDAKEFGKDQGAFFYHTMTKGELSKLAKRPDFIGDNIRAFINSNPNGNFVLQSYETQLNATGNEYQTTATQNKYRLVEYWGSVDRAQVIDIFPDLDPDQFDVEVNVWMLNNIVIKCILNPFESGKRPYHVFNYKKTDSMLLGSGLCELLEQFQRAINAVSRAIHNNMAFIAEPIFELNQDLLVPGTSINEIFPGLIIRREGTTETGSFPALRTLPIVNHLQELMALEKSYRDKMDDISNLQQIMQGDLSNQATLGRTASGINQLMGAANITLRDFARNFDFFNESILSLLIEWNMMFNDDDTIKGDYQVYPRVSTALIEKQLTANNLNALMQTMTPQEAQYLNYEAVLDARLRANNLDPDLIKLSDTKIAQNQEQAEQSQQAQEQAQQQAAQQSKAESDANINAINSKAQAEIIKANATNTKVNIDTQLNKIKTLHQVENDRAKQELSEGQFTNQIMNEDHEQNLSREEIANAVSKVGGLNPNLNVQPQVVQPQNQQPVLTQGQ